MSWIKVIGQNAFTQSFIKERIAVGGSGGGAANPDFVSTWDTTKAGSASDTVVLPLLSGGTYSGTIDWGDGNSSALSYANRTHVYASSGTYSITLSGTMVGYRFINSGDKAKILDISNWGELNPTTNRGFMGCSNLDVSATDAPIITANNLDYMFYNCTSLTTADFSQWDTSTVTTAQGTFQNCVNFNGQLDNWVHSGVTSLHTFFFNADRFAGNLDSWDTSGVTNWYETFRGAGFFNASMAGWVIRGNMHSSFLCNSNNTLQGLGMDTWDTSQMTRFGAYNCANLNPDVSNWDTSSLLIAQGCWQSCSSFDQNMANWDVNQVTNFTNFMLGSGLSTANYDATLIAWDAQGTMAFSGTVNFGTSQYSCIGEAARTSLITKWGGITDGGLNTSINCDFVSTWDTNQAGSASNTVVLPLLSGGTYSGTIDWGDSSTSPTSYGNRTHVYAAGGTYTITITGQIDGWKFANAGDKAKITDISNWGSLNLTTKQAFFGCANLDISATDAPTITTTSMEYAFRGCSSLTAPDFSNFDVSLVTSFLGTFQINPLFNGLIETWDMSSATLVQSMLSGAAAFNRDISNWDMSSVTDAVAMLYGALLFNQPIGSWDFSANLKIKLMMYNNDAFDQALANWSVTQMTDMTSFMLSATGISTANYDALLIAWDAQGTMAFSGTVNFGGSQYTPGGAAEAARTSLITKWGAITDGGAA